MTYTDIQNIYKTNIGKGISSCAIADAKRKLGFKVKISPNRIDKNKIQKEATESEIKEVKKIISEKKKTSR